MDNQIRKATPADEDGILECLRAAFLPHRERYSERAFADTVLAPDTFRERLDEMQILVAADADGQVMGTIAYKVAGSEGHLRGMAVVPQLQGSGLAQRLLERAESELRAAGCRAVTLDTTKPLKRAIRFYERNGFCPTGAIASFFGMELLAYRKEL